MSRLLIVVLVLLAGCTAGPERPEPTPTPPPVTSASVGTPLTVGDVTVSLDPAPTDPTVDQDGATTVSTSGTLQITLPADTAAEPLADGSVLLRDTAGTAVAALDVDGATSTLDGDTLTLTPLTGSATVTLATVAVRSATWADRDDEGGRSLAVVPSDWARGGGLAVDALLWAQVIAAAPDADSQGMHDQLTCHQIGAPDKESWNLEPWRPEVGLVQTMLERCNPE
ncbi:DUF2599 domain-containing protein [Cellulomonas taurus]|uniref:DUF2599 domain-containing protein n=1 Tax=Cellulomonas taurus TaxID=2729175 RepID=UPI00145DABAA|nr:DUF2599 domain-containing protein [Cellulomonas taurus]